MREVTVTQDTISQEPGKAMPARWRMSVLAVANLVVGIAVGVTFAKSTANEAYPGDGGVVYVCNGKALALVHASGLKNLEMEVQFPVRGDGNLLPLPVDGVEVLAGRATGYQYYRPVDGKLAVARERRAVWDRHNFTVERLLPDGAWADELRQGVGTPAVRRGAP